MGQNKLEVYQSRAVLCYFRRRRKRGDGFIYSVATPCCATVGARLLL